MCGDPLDPLAESSAVVARPGADHADPVGLRELDGDVRGQPGGQVPPAPLAIDDRRTTTAPVDDRDGRRDDLRIQRRCAVLQHPDQSV